VKQISYKKIGKTVFVHAFLAGTSNSATTTFTLPYSLAGGADIRMAVPAKDNNTIVTGAVLAMSQSSNVVTFYKDLGGSGWTNSSTKEVFCDFAFQATS
jgi:hypothetical protein